MGISATELAPLFMAGLTHLQVREVCEAAVGVKASRLNLYDWQLKAVREWCDDRGLYLEASDYLVQENILTEYKGRWSNVGRRFTSSGFRFVYISRDDGIAREACQREQEDDFAAEYMGQVLKIPPCCVSFFLQNKKCAVEEHNDEYFPLIIERQAPALRFDWRMNYSAQYFGVSLFSHYPCSFTCEGTLARAAEAAEIVQKISPIWLETFKRHMQAVTAYEPCGAVHLLLSEPDREGRVSVAPQQVLSTAPTVLSNAIRDAEGARLTEHYTLEVERPRAPASPAETVWAAAFVK